MAEQGRTTLKSYFETGDKPTQVQFEDLIDSVPNTSDSGVSNTEFGYLDGVTSAIQTQIDSKQDELTGLTASVTELNYSDGVTSAIQTQLDGKLANVVDDTTPQLGGNLDLNSNDITGTGNIDITGSVTSGEFIGDLNGYIRFTGKNRSGGIIEKGQVVYISGLSGNTPEVDLARADSLATMPAYGIAISQIADNNDGEFATFGSLKGLNISNWGETGISFNVGDVLYISATEAGRLTNVAPTGESNFIQNIGKLERATPTSNTTIKVGGAGRSNATPNLNNGKIFLGNGSNQAVSTTLDTSVVPENTNLYYTDSRVQAVSINNVVEDTSPQLGGNLDVNGNDITGNPAIDGRRAIIVETDASRTLSLGDAGDFIIATNVDDPTTITIPTNASVAFTTGTEIDFIQKTAEKLTIQADGGVTLNGVDRGSTSITAQWGGATIKKIDTDEWIIVGKINDVA
jgi:hypothetical protein